MWGVTETKDGYTLFEFIFGWHWHATVDMTTCKMFFLNMFAEMDGKSMSMRDREEEKERIIKGCDDVDDEKAFQWIQ